MLYQTFTEFLQGKRRIGIIQAENPDADSLGSALALDYLLDGIETSLYCPVDIPQYLRYMDDWSRVTGEFDYEADGYIIVDTAAEVLLSKMLEEPAIRERLWNCPVFVLDHHTTDDDISFPHQGLVQVLPACCDLIYKIGVEQGLIPGPGAAVAGDATPVNADSAPVDVDSTPVTDASTPVSEASAVARSDSAASKAERLKKAAEYLYGGIESDTLGLTTENVTSDTFRVVANLVDLGINISQIEEKRREFMKKSARILDYKADLIKKVEYHMDGRVATVHIPWEEIEEYSNEYNPNVLILEELRLVQGVEVAVAVKTYPDGRVTGKIRATTPVADKIAEYFGGGGHPYAAGFRTYDISYLETVREIITAFCKLEQGAA